VEAPELEMAVTLPGVVELVAIGDFGEPGAGILGERVEEEAVNDEGEELGAELVHLVFQGIGCRFA